ncbi:MAG TPA: acyl-CoA thioesterase II [Rhodoblastus sp.]|nr:acyl-CoA thioesterase II [Rhodoblastus sp.]
MTISVRQLLDALDLAAVGPDQFRGGTPPSSYPRVFGGQVVAQALTAAARTVEKRMPHSLNVRFMVGADPKLPIEFAVARLRDGGSFSARRVTVAQNGRAIAELSASFSANETGFEHSDSMPDVARPEKLASEARLRADVMPGLVDPAPRHYEDERPVEVRPVEPTTYFSRTPRAGVLDVWLRATDKLPDDPMTHCALLAFMSDMSLQDASLVPHGLTFYDFGLLVTASLDHSVWFHGPFRADDWLLFVQKSPWAGSGRGLCLGSIYTRDGRLIASTAQEGMARRRKTA